MTPAQLKCCLLWIALAILAGSILVCLFTGGMWSLLGLSVALNLFLLWQKSGHEEMLRLLGLR